MRFSVEVTSTNVDLRSQSRVSLVGREAGRLNDDAEIMCYFTRETLVLIASASVVGSFIAD